ncbi:hypothetical protein [Auritidibacter ignavus]|uniref:hypothetical protein n=1 Tax=Auritidibacter ignavus TaxID=678932 RepID=UPI00109C553D|nr:hypothetical protein [Auritidibacter ignavus]
MCEDSGQTSILLMGICAVLLSCAVTILAITQVNLQSRKLLSTADTVASVAAADFRLDTPATSEPNSNSVVTQTPRLNARSARGRVEDYLNSSGAYQRFGDLDVIDVRVLGGDTVVVELTAQAEVPVVSWFLPDGVEVHAESSARTSLQR